MFCYPKEYQLGIRPMKAEDIIEVDNFSELVALDASYADYAERGRKMNSKNQQKKKKNRSHDTVMTLRQTEWI